MSAGPRRGASSSRRRSLRETAHELGLGTDHVGDRVKPDRLRHHTAPAGFEGAKDVALRLGRWRRGEQEGIAEPEAGKWTDRLADMNYCAGLR